MALSKFTDAMTLTIELVPQSCWYSNVRSNVSREEWDSIRQIVYKRAGFKCEICGGVGKKHPVECHEVWRYDDTKLVQTLVGMIALCPLCHQVKHFGLSQIKGLRAESVAHLEKVNKWTHEKAEQYINEAFEIWQRRSNKKWKLDLKWLEKIY